MSIIKVFDRIDESVVRSFEDLNCLTLEKDLRIRIKSDGGNYGSFGEISPILFRIAQRKIRIIGEAINAGSAAMLLFLNCSYRLVETTSLGYIHLPEPNTDDVSEELVEKTKKEAVAFIKKRTHLTEDTILSLNNVILSANDMIKLHIANEKVKSFEAEQ